MSAPARQPLTDLTYRDWNPQSSERTAKIERPVPPTNMSVVLEHTVSSQTQLWRQHGYGERFQRRAGRRPVG